MFNSFYFVRHGETEWNKNNIFQGHNDIPLNESGRKQAQDKHNIFVTHKNIKFFSSPLQRAKETAQIITDNNPDITLIPEFMECNSLQGATYLLQKKGVTNYPSMENLDPNGEPPHIYIEKVRKGLEIMFSQAKQKTPILFAHGGTCAAICEALDLNVFKTPNCSIFYFKYRNQRYEVEKYD